MQSNFINPDNTLEGGINLSLRNMLRMLEAANEEFIAFRREELGMEPRIFVDVAYRCGFEAVFRGKGTKKRIKLRKRGIPIVKLYDKETSNKINYLDIADIHAGHPDFSPEMLDEVLSKYHRDGKPSVDYVFIAGDLFEGVTDKEFCFELVNAQPRMHTFVEGILKHQVNLLFNVLSKYDFDYRAINGNHEYTFEQLGFDSPIKLLEEKMRKAGKKFTYYDTYIVDFIMGGVVKRMMHLESFYQRDGAVHSYDRLETFKRHGGLNPCYEGKKYPIRFFQCGHIHRREELYEARDKVFISQSGSFIKTELFYLPVIHVKGEVLEDNRILRE